MTRHSALPLSLPPRGVCRLASAQYVGVSATKFDEMVLAGQMPRPKRVGSRCIWDRMALDVAFDALPGDGSADEAQDAPNPWDSAV